MQRPQTNQTPRPTRPASPAAAQATSGELQALEARRSELRSQLTSLTQRRALLDAQARQVTGAARANLDARIATLDERTNRIDDELNSVDDQVNAALARGATRAPNPFDNFIQMRDRMATLPGAVPPISPRKIDMLYNVVAVEGIGILLLGFVLWRTWRRRGPVSVARLAPEDSGRIDALQRAVDVIAVEVERISEGQRYVNKVLGENQQALGAGAASEVAPRRREPERSKLSND